MDAGHPRYFARLVNGDPAGLVFAEAVEPPNTTAIPGNRPVQAAYVSLGGGVNHDETTISAADYQDALALLERIDDVNLVAAPGRADQDVQLALIAHCENLRDRFALLETPRGAPMIGAGGAEGHRPSVNSARGYAALYYPWLSVSSVKSGEAVPIPPAGHVAGVYARTDSHRGVHKAPAGMETTVNGVLGVATTMSDEEQGLLNLMGINVIRVFQAGGRSVVWGARTTATDKNWQYVNIRRLFLFLEESIQEGIRWAVFEPNNLALWQKLKRSIGAFLTQQWRDGALFGAKAEEAFYVRIDEALNPDSERALGRLYIEIGVRPSYPAEFIIVRIGIWQGGSEVSEG
jgi:phage tail sheath protein FI